VLVFSIVKAQEYGWTSARTVGTGALAVALLAAFVVIELRSREPLIRLGIFRVRSLMSANVSMLFVVSGLFAMFLLRVAVRAGHPRLQPAEGPAHQRAVV
jgi:hypothetical protein